jgi:hypothetical protein
MSRPAEIGVYGKNKYTPSTTAGSKVIPGNRNRSFTPGGKPRQQGPPLPCRPDSVAKAVPLKNTLSESKPKVGIGLSRYAPFFPIHSYLYFTICFHFAKKGRVFFADFIVTFCYYIV